MAKQAKKPGYLSDGGGLVLQITKSGGKSWLFRYRAATGKIREMGLGSLEVVTLADARRKAEDAQRQRADGQDPIHVKREREVHARVEAAKGVTFKWCAEKYIASNKAGWSNAKHAAQWTATLEEYVYPTFKNIPVAAIDTAVVTKALEAIWSTKLETATRVRQRIERVLRGPRCTNIVRGRTQRHGAAISIKFSQSLPTYAKRSQSSIIAHSPLKTCPS